MNVDILIQQAEASRIRRINEDAEDPRPRLDHKQIEPGATFIFRVYEPQPPSHFLVKEYTVRRAWKNGRFYCGSPDYVEVYYYGHRESSKRFYLTEAADVAYDTEDQYHVLVFVNNPYRSEDATP